MNNWKPGIRTIKKEVSKSGSLLRLIIAVCVTLKLDAKEVFKNLSNHKGKAFAQTLSDEMGESSRKELESAINSLTKTK